jgi:single-strand DNA-binding protein
MQIITITGNVGKDPVIRSTQGGDKVCSFSVGSKQGWGDKASTNWFNCSVWGKRGDTVAEHVRKGSKVTITGEFSTRDWEGKTQLEIRVNDLDWAKAEGAAPRQASDATAASKPAFDADLDDDLSDLVPF